jgi:hypothetical protein
MRTRLLAASLLGAPALICCTPAAAAATSSLEYLSGGSLSCRTGLSLGFLYGAGSRPGPLGAPVSTVSAGPAGATGNPAALAFIERNALVLDAVPGLGVPAAEVLDAENRAADAVDDAIADIAADDIVLIYPELDAWAGQQGGVVSGLAALRFGRVAAAVAFEEPLALDLRFVDTGIEAFAEALKSENGGETEILARCFLDAAGSAVVSMSRTTMAAAVPVTPALGLGASVSRYSASARIAGTLRADGIVDYGGQEYAFNDPDDPWHNDLGASASGAFEGSALGWTAGASWRPLGWLSLDAAWCGAPRLELDGSLTSVENTVPAVDEDGGVDLEQISASQPTLTEETVTVHEGPLVLDLPSYAAGAATAVLGPVRATLEYRSYAGGLAYSFEDASEGVDLRSGLGIEFDCGALWGGGGVVRGTVRGDAEEGREAEDVTIPFANVGFGLRLGPDVALDTLILAVPVQVVRVSASYEF